MTMTRMAAGSDGGGQRRKLWPTRAGRRTLHQVLVGCDLLRRRAALDDLEQREQDPLGVLADAPWPNLQSCARVVTKARTPRKTREGERGDAQEGIVLLDEEDALDREGSVGVDDEGRVLEVRDQERQNREELILGELRAAAGGAVVSELLFPARSTRREPTLPACGT